MHSAGICVKVTLPHHLLSSFLLLFSYPSILILSPTIHRPLYTHRPEHNSREKKGPPDTALALKKSNKLIASAKGNANGEGKISSKMELGSTVFIPFPFLFLLPHLCCHHNPMTIPRKLNRRRCHECHGYQQGAAGYCIRHS